MKTKAETICVLIGGYFITLIITCILFLIITNLINLDIWNKEFDQGAAFIGILGWSATIYTVIVAAYLFNDWKEQHNKAFHSERALELINLIKNINKKINLTFIPIGHYNNFATIYSELMGNLGEKQEEFMAVAVISLLEGDENIKKFSDTEYSNKILETEKKLGEHLRRFFDEYNIIIELKEELYLECTYYLSYTVNKKSLKLIEDTMEILSRLDNIHNDIKNNIINTFKYHPHPTQKELKKYETTFFQVKLDFIEITKKLYKETKA